MIVIKDDSMRVQIKSWCENPEAGAIEQAKNKTMNAPNITDSPDCKLSAILKASNDQAHPTAAGAMRHIRRSSSNE